MGRNGHSGRVQQYPKFKPSTELKVESCTQPQSDQSSPLPDKLKRIIDAAPRLIPVYIHRFIPAETNEQAIPFARFVKQI
jgi:hypothetical protein